MIVNIRRSFNKELAAIIAIVGVAGMSMAILQPVMPLYLTSIQMTPAMIGLMLATGMVGMVFGESSGGWLADRVGPKFPLTVGTFLCIPMVLSFVFFRQITFIFVIFFVWGVIRSTIFGPSRGYIGNNSSLHNKATLIAVYTATQSAFRSLGSLASGFIADNLGYNWNFYTSAAISLIAGILVFIALRKIPIWKHGSSSAATYARVKFKPVKQRVRYKPFLLQCLLPVLFLLGMGANSFLPLLATQVIKVDATQVGIIFTVGGLANMLLLLPMGRLADRRSKKVLMVSGLFLSAIAFCGIAFSTTFLELILFTVVNSAAFAIFTPASVALLSNSVPGYWQGTAMGIYGASEDLGIIIGSSAAGYIWTDLGPPSVFLMGSITCAAGAVICLAFIREKSLLNQTVEV